MPPIFTPAPLNCRGVFFAVRCRCSSSPIRQSRRFYRVHSALTSSTANRARIPCVSRLFTPLSAFLTSPAGNHRESVHAMITATKLDLYKKTENTMELTEEQKEYYEKGINLMLDGIEYGLEGALFVDWSIPQG